MLIKTKFVLFIFINLFLMNLIDAKYRYVFVNLSNIDVKIDYFYKRGGRTDIPVLAKETCEIEEEYLITKICFRESNYKVWLREEAEQFTFTITKSLGLISSTPYDVYLLKQ